MNLYAPDWMNRLLDHWPSFRRTFRCSGPTNVINQHQSDQRFRSQRWRRLARLYPVQAELDVLFSYFEPQFDALDSGVFLHERYDDPALVAATLNDIGLVENKGELRVGPVFGLIRLASSSG